MAEYSYFWDLEVLGDCGPYDQSHLMDAFFRAIFNTTGNLGVLREWLDELEVSGAASPLTVATGGAGVYGLFYENDDPVSVSVPAPATGTRTDLIVVRRDWPAQTARIARVAGPGAALTQTPLVRYEVPLASVAITAAGLVTITDTREWTQFSTDWPANAVDTEHYAAASVTPAKVPDRSRSRIKGSGSLEPDSANPCAWVAGGAYDYWEYSDAANDTGWVYFMVPTGIVASAISVYVWSVPDVNGLGGGAENCEWDWTVYYGASGGLLNSAVGTAVVDQQARVNTTAYRDLLVNMAVLAPLAGEQLILKLSRDGVADSYNNAMRCLGAEIYWTADA